MMCQILKVSRNAYYRWLRKGEGPRLCFQIKLEKVITEEFHNAKERYGSPRLTLEVNNRMKVSRPTVAKYMKRMGLRCRYAKKYKVTTDSKHDYKVADNLLDRHFKVEKPGLAYVSDITYIPLSSGFLYLTTVIDLFDRKPIGWSISKGMTAEETVLPALKMALASRMKNSKLIFHSDRCVQYACNATVNFLKSFNITQSMSRKGNCWDNAVAESFFKSLKMELLYGNKKDNYDNTKLAIFEYLEVWYNRKRRHSALNNRTIEEFWRDYYNNSIDNVA